MVMAETSTFGMDIPDLLRGWGEAAVTNDWGIIYSLWCTSHEHLVLSRPPKNILTPNWMNLFSLESHLTGEPCDYFLVSIIVARNNVLTCIFCIVWCQQISIWNKQIESSIYLIKQVGKHARTQKVLSEVPNLLRFFFANEGRVDPNTTISGPSTARQWYAI